MKYSILGKTGLKVSRIGFGGIPIQHVDKENSRKLISRAVELGINLIDTARGYTGSESLIGYGLEGLRDKVHLATKSMAREKAAMRKDIELSLKLLETDYIDLYQLHNVGTLQDLDKVTAPGGALEALIECRNAGIIKHIGITSHSLDVIEKALNNDIFETIQYPYNAVEIQAQEVFRKARGMNLGVIAMKPLGGGALRNAKAALKFILHNPDISSAIPGMDSIEQVEENVSTVDEMPLLEEERLALMKEATELGERFCRRCGYCQPCPQGINIPMIFILESYYTRYDLKDWAVERYKALSSKADACAKCGICESKCPYKLPIRDMLDSVKNILG